MHSERAQPKEMETGASHGLARVPEPQHPRLAEGPSHHPPRTPHLCQGQSACPHQGSWGPAASLPSPCPHPFLLRASALEGPRSAALLCGDPGHRV